MNQKIWELFEAKKILLRDLKRLDLSEFTKKRSLEAFFGVDTKNFYEVQRAGFCLKKPAR